MLAASCLSGVACAGDKEDVMAVIDKYIQYEESGDMISQGKLMTNDRSMVYVGGRLTGHNRKLMEEQQQDEDQHKKEFPGVHYKVAIKDLQMQLYNGDSALVIVDWYPTRVVPASLPPETVKKLGPAKTPLIVGLMLVKQQGACKIASSTFVAKEKSES
jgi:hypothetical protein